MAEVGGVVSDPRLSLFVRGVSQLHRLQLREVQIIAAGYRCIHSH
jgi:hypothetical protein